MTSLLAVLKARRRMLAPLIPLAVAAYDYLAGSGEMAGFYLGMALVAAYVNLPARYFRYQPRTRK